MSKVAFDIHAVSPKVDPKFSPNFYAWLKKNFGKKSHKAPEVFRAGHGGLYVGYMSDGDFIGSQLSATLSLGARSEVCCYVNGKFRRIAFFWAKYLKLGRCFFDPEHKFPFNNRLWKESARRRTCPWCGHVQKKVTKRRTVVETTWVAV